MLFFFLISFGFYFLLEPEYSLIYVRYEIDNDKIIENKGIITRKTEIIPWRLVSKVEMIQGILGRIFNYGDIFVSDVSEAHGIKIKGISNPKKILQIIEERISSFKEGLT